MNLEDAHESIQEALLRRAINASVNGDSTSAITILREAVSRPDRTGTGHFLLASQYAQMQLYEQAILEMEKAVALDPTLQIAQLHLGLLHLTCAHVEPALQVLLPLADADLTSPLPCFAKGLVHLIRDEFADCLHWLGLGMKLNSQNHALNVDMEKIINQVKTIISTPAASLQVNSDKSGSPDSQHFFLSTYTGSKKH